jgi:hypothetical protein
LIFFSWAKNNSEFGCNDIVDIAKRYHGLATWPWDKAFAIAGAYLSITQNLKLRPEVISINRAREEVDFPYWVAIDKHTKYGRDVIGRVARKIKISPEILGWISFYCESTKTNNLKKSLWWNQEILWKCSVLKITQSEMNDIWNESYFLIEMALKEKAENLRLYLMSESNRNADHLFGEN